jgi:RNA polymerase sigma-70 factor (ECF subfamily)
MFLKVCARYAKDMEDAEQLLNDGFLKIFNNIAKFSGQGSFEGWMRRVVVNTCLDYLRTKDLKQAMVMHVNAVPPEDTVISVSNSGLENIEFKELVSLIQGLPVMTRTVFNLFVFEGYNHAEIAAQFKISEKTSQWHVHQARSLLQKKLKKSDPIKVNYETKSI